MAEAPGLQEELRGPHPLAPGQGRLRRPGEEAPGLPFGKEGLEGAPHQGVEADAPLPPFQKQVLGVREEEGPFLLVHLPEEGEPGGPVQDLLGQGLPQVGEKPLGALQGELGPQALAHGEEDEPQPQGPAPDEA